MKNTKKIKTPEHESSIVKFCFLSKHSLNALGKRFIIKRIFNMLKFYLNFEDIFVKYIRTKIPPEQIKEQKYRKVTNLSATVGYIESKINIISKEIV